MDDLDVKEMIWENASNSTCKAHCKEVAQDTSYTRNIQFTPSVHKGMENTFMNSLHKTNLYTEKKYERQMASGEQKIFSQYSDVNKGKQNGSGHTILPARFMLSQKPKLPRPFQMEARNLSGTLNAVAGKPNHTFMSAFEKAFPIRNTPSSTAWAGACHRSPKKMQRKYSTVEETVREEEKEIYRQLIQVVTGKTLLTSKSTTIIPPQVSRCMSSSNSISGKPVTSSKSSLEPSCLDVESSYQASFNHLQPSAPSLEPLICDTANEPFTLDKQGYNHQQPHTEPSVPKSRGSDSAIVYDFIKPLEPPRQPYFQAELWIKELTSVYDSRARERRRQIEEQTALALKLQTQRLQEHSVHDNVDLHLRVPLEKEIPVTLIPKQKDQSLPKEVEFPELTEEMEREIKHALFGGSQDQILSDGFRLTITRKDLMTLHSLNWLNDEIINFYMNLLMERSNRKGLPKVFAFNTFFFTKLKTAGYQAVKRWTKKVDVFAMNILLLPIHLGVHWCLAVIDFRKKSITYYDSMGGLNNEACRLLLQYLKQECLDKKGTSFDSNGWTSTSKKSHEIPQQMNGSDCGMFACKYADYITKDKPITFTQVR
ncbi:hypothetical protein GDO86_004408 [Hymenochirus boettgeri]|uniref:Ubiquitin-like protease family profile domain-containing protein n=1 Tax=Hymenochirus boettgeri TaxID=247094 RepID=A0A8T2K7R0_9PIPI|nr:hypothetical protein GDO86_004408 [Hymenochirus boettgeri]